MMSNRKGRCYAFENAHTQEHRAVGKLCGKRIFSN
jgi:hypothetical protein